MKPDMQRHTLWYVSLSASQAAMRKGDSQPTLRPLPCQAPMGTRSSESRSPSQ